MLMQRVREYIYSRRRQKLSRLYERSNELRIALAGISYLHHPDVWDEVADDLQRTNKQAEALAQKTLY